MQYIISLEHEAHASSTDTTIFTTFKPSKDKWTDRRQTEEGMDRQAKGGMDRQIGGWMDGLELNRFCLFLSVQHMYGHNHLFLL